MLFLTFPVISTLIKVGPTKTSERFSKRSIPLDAYKLEITNSSAVKRRNTKKKIPKRGRQFWKQ